MNHQGIVCVADTAKPVTTSAGSNHWAIMQVAHWHWDSHVDLAFHRLPVCALGEAGLHPVAGQRLELGIDVGGVPVPQHATQIGVVTVWTGQGARFNCLDQHGTRAAETHPQRMTGSAIPLAVVGHLQRIA
jgi:hypothetical protein